MMDAPTINYADAFNNRLGGIGRGATFIDYRVAKALPADPRLDRLATTTEDLAREWSDTIEAFTRRAYALKGKVQAVIDDLAGESVG